MYFPLIFLAEHSESRASRGTVRSPVWNFFNFNEATEKSACQVQLSNQNICAQTISGKYPTNLKQHLRTPKSIQKCCKLNHLLRRRRKKHSHGGTPFTTKQVPWQIDNQSLSSGKHYKKESDRYQEITRKLAIFVAGSNIANSIVESAEFRDLLNTLNGRYKMPQRAVISEEI